MKKFTLLLLLLSLFFFAKAQNDTLNKFDSQGKKNGTWMQYYDSRLNEIKDASKASYYRYTYFEHGKNIFIWHFAGGKDWILTHTGQDTLNAVKMQKLDGEYTWKDNKGRTREVLDFKDGYSNVLTDYRSSGALCDIWDYTKKYKEKNLSYRVSEYDKKGNVKYYWFYKYFVVSNSESGT